MKLRHLLFVLLLAAVGIAQAEVVFVKPGGTGDGKTWNTAAGSDINALFATFTGLDPVKVWFQEGEYQLTEKLLTKRKVNMYGGFVGTETTLDQRDLKKKSTLKGGTFGMIEANAEANAEDATLIDGFIFKGTDLPVFPDGVYGSVVLFSNRNISNCIFVDNIVQKNVLYLEGLGYNCLFYNNTCVSGNGVLQLLGNSRMYNASIVKNKGIRPLRIAATSKLYNSIVWGNENRTIHVDGSAAEMVNCALDVPYDWSGTAAGAVLIKCVQLNSDNASALGPNFADVKNNNFRLSNKSTLCLNAGDNSVLIGIDKDIEGNMRIQNDTVDMGCYEGAFDGVVTPVYSNVIYIKAGGTGDGTTWEKAMDSPDKLNGEMIFDNCKRDIWVAEGSYNLTKTIKLPTTVSLYGGFAGTETQLDERDATKKTTLIGGEFTMLVAKAGTAETETFVDGFVMKGTNVPTQGTNADNGNIDLYAYRNIRNCIITGNIFWKSGAIHVSNSKIINCLIYDNTTTSASGCVTIDTKAQVINSTIVNNKGDKDGKGTANNWGGLRVGGLTGTDHCIVCNTIIWGNTKFEVTNGSYPYQVRVDAANAGQFYNCAIQDGNGTDFVTSTTKHIQFGNATPGAVVSLITLSSDNIDATGPNFTNSMTDFTLTLLSPCINKGDDTKAAGIVKDLNGAPRLQGTVDVGAYEYSASGSENMNKSNDGKSISLFPNPAVDYIVLPVENIEQITIFNALGMTIQNISMPMNGRLDVFSLASGIYFVKIDTKEGARLGQFIKQ